MARKVILDLDAGIDDAVALIMALGNPDLELVAATAVAGNVTAEQATRNVQALVERLDPPRWPRLGAASDAVRALPDESLRRLYGTDGLGNANFAVADLVNRHASSKVLADEIRSSPGQVAIIALGPLTNVAQMFRQDPGLVELVDQIIVVGGTLQGPGDVTPVAEFNVYCDPLAARDVMRLPLTKTFLPLDVTGQVAFTYDMFEHFPPTATKTGGLLHQLVGYLVRSTRQVLGQESVRLPDAVALQLLLHPELFEVQRYGGDVETEGVLTTGATIFDRRAHPQWRGNVHVAVNVDAPAVIDAVFRGMNAAAEALG